MKNKAEFIRLGSFALILIAGISAAISLTHKEKKLKIFAPADLNPNLVDASLHRKTRLHRIADFSLINQEGKTVTEKDFEGKIYVADFFFTTCPSICPVMSEQMERVYQNFEDNSDIMFLSHTVYPEVDSVPLLAEYAKKHHADPDKWMFVTGDKEHIYQLARKSYFAVTTEGTGDEHDFIHTENFILVDKEKRIRGFYDGTSEEDIDRLMEEIDILLKEYEK